MRPLLDAYAALDGVDAVLLSGSTARGDADRWSDVEVGVVWSREPSAGDRAAVPAADFRIVTPRLDHLHLGAKRPDGLLVEVLHSLTSEVEEVLDAVLRSCEPDPRGLDLIKGIVEGREIRGVRAGLVEAGRPGRRRIRVALRSPSWNATV